MVSPSLSPTGVQRALCIVDPTLTGEGGHSLAYDRLLAEAARSFGHVDHVEIFADRTFRAEKRADVHAALGLLRLDGLKARLRPVWEKLRPARPIEPVPLDFRFTATDPWEPLRMWSYVGKRLRALDLAWSLYRLLNGRYSRVVDVHMVFQNAGMEEVFCLEILRGFLDAWTRAVTIHLVFRHIPERTCSRVAGMARFAALLKRQGALRHVRMYTDTEELTASFASLAPAPGQFQTLPVPSLIQKTSVPDRKNGTFRLGMLGPSRMEKGFGCLPVLLGALPAKAAGRTLELVVQTGAGTPDRETRAVTAILEKHAERTAGDPGAVTLRLLPGPLDAGTYASCFAGLDGALVLHSSPKYAASSSGIFVEALHLGIPSIVFAGTWMGKRIRQAAEEGLSIGRCVDTLGEAPAAIERIAAEQTLFSKDIAEYLARHARRFDPDLLAATLFGNPPGASGGENGAGTC
ncbi:MAG: hypothetical protein LBS65_10470 [Desulfovibrio sp.]|jgi:hypothetical protein|nr:hypothetical protein [Desulfovibrio sp.]